MYVILVGGNGESVARLYVERTWVTEWLQRSGPASTCCEIYTDAPEKGGTRIAVLRRNPQNNLWGLAAER